ncbi:MAG: primosomal protein N' [Oscillospiraceae bacterium]|nr:primosomal protein N' [Oscillospiraceae bacterium]
MSVLVAKIAVSAATYWIDRPYDYLVPEEFSAQAKPGMRVYVPFSQGNRRSEGVILALNDHSDYEKLKPILALLDDEPVLDEEQIKLALFMRERFFCTVYDAVKAMLPAGFWFKDDGERRAKDKTVEMARLRLQPEDAAAIADGKRLRSPQQANLLDLLCSFSALPSRELLRFTGAGRQSLKALVNAELVELYQREVYRRPDVFVGETEPLPVLNAEQQNAFDGIDALASNGEAGAALLFGVTGSGKTSVYLHQIARQLERGRSAILLVPEIALTPQMLHTFSSHFGDEVAVLHSSLSVGERYDEWKRVRAGKARLVIGTRSAVFAPCRDLGLIIIDEEQEETYKSENSPRYNARDIAKFRCARANCLLLLGSATPDIVSRYAAETGRYSYFRLKNRFNEQELPAVRIVDMKRELRRGNGGSISAELRDELASNIERGEQSILFINRRGAHKLVSCGSCGYTYRCPRCSVSLTYHSARNRLICHYCGYSRRVDESCPDCGGILKYIGVGTQMVETELHELFPEIQVMRMDTDTVTPAGSHDALFTRFREENIPVMVGTQMVTKGLNFENVTLVGVLSADQSLYAGDYRAGERTFSLITQVVGRSGRGEKPGRAVIQTYTPDNETIRQAARQDYDAFYASELELRRLQNAPPFRDILTLTASGPDERTVLQVCRHAKDRLAALLGPRSNAELLGPTPLAVVRVNNRFRYRVIVNGKNSAALRAALSQTVCECNTDRRFRGVCVFADNDPID